ncbi:hypothetical protein HU200_057181 [Digitaria exilis]|uniref:F-box domain-containing protein n=1 Tax=Digitaria exilis TaxID=1010633 RepID=A0A835AK79_9POAL|nr:hypothetical protein HU200_057181 [Digitaria exilis]
MRIPRHRRRRPRRRAVRTEGTVAEERRDPPPPHPAMRASPASGRRPLQHLWYAHSTADPPFPLNLLHRRRRPFLPSRGRAMVAGSGSKKMARTTRRRPNPTALLMDDLLVKILAHVPYRSLCRFRLVCTRWRALIDHPDHRARLPQTLVGVEAPPFMHASFSFLPDRERERLQLVDCCNGLLLCRSYSFADDKEFDYLVLNPATEKWWSNKVQTVRFGFNPSNFDDEDDDENDDGDNYVLGVKIFSSATGLWIHKQMGWQGRTQY